MDMSVSGLASGFDWSTLVDQLAEAERVPQKTLTTQQNTLKQQNSAYSNLQTQLNSLKAATDALSKPDLYNVRTSTSSDTTVANAAAAAGTTQGSYVFKIFQMATTATLNGQANVGGNLGTASSTLADAGFATNVTTGTFTVNGKPVAISGTSQSLQNVFDSIKDATTDSAGNYVEAAYDSDNDKITLTSKSSDGTANNTPIVLGATTDTSNFLAIAKLNYNNSGAVTSSAKLGAVKLTATLEKANFATPVTGGTTGQFKINGVVINYDTTQDSVTNILGRINDSAAGVAASYDSANNLFKLTNKTTGDNGVAMEDVQGNFLSASGMLNGTLQRGQNLLYSVNDGGQLTSQSNTIADSSSGIAGLTVTAVKAGTIDNPAVSTVTVASNTDAVTTAINGFISAYNQTQSMIDSYSAVTTAADGTVTAGVLSNEKEASEISAALRSKSFDSVSGMTGPIKGLASLGINTSGYDDKLTLTDSSVLANALRDNLPNVQKLFTQDTTGVATRLSAFIVTAAGENGTLGAKETTLTKQSAAIDTQIAAMEKVVLADKARLKSSFVAMETAEAKINQQSSYLKSKFG